MNLVNGKSSSSISIFDRGFLYGDSIFETILVINNKPNNLELHLKRLKKGCDTLKIKNLDYSLLQKYIKKSLSNINNCILNITITRGTVKKRGYNIALANLKPNIILTTSTIPRYPRDYQEKGIKTKFSNTMLSCNQKLSKIKHSNRLDHIMATDEITKKFPELILCDQKNNIIEGISSNIFFIKKDTLYTPLINDSGVEGVMKYYILKLLKKNKYKVKHKKIKKSDIKCYDGAFFCNSVRLIWNIKSINDHKYSNSEIIKEIIRLLKNDIYK